MIRTNTKIFKGVFYLLLCILLISLIINVYLYNFSREFIFSNEKMTKNAQLSDSEPTAIVLGASVYHDGRLTPIVEERAQAAISLYSHNIVSKILVTGDSSSKYYDEVTPIKNFLVQNGVPKNKIMIDNAGVDTFESMRRARNIFQVNSAVIVTQRFHLSRAVYLARKFGIKAYGFPAGVGIQYAPYNDVREFFASVKSFVESINS